MPRMTPAMARKMVDEMDRPRPAPKQSTPAQQPMRSAPVPTEAPGRARDAVTSMTVGPSFGKPIPASSVKPPISSSSKANVEKPTPAQSPARSSPVPTQAPGRSGSTVTSNTVGPGFGKPIPESGSKVAVQRPMPMQPPMPAASGPMPRSAPGMKKGGSVGSASKRADGIAQRGKTKGRMI